jgi:hypothetical protein
MGLGPVVALVMVLVFTLVVVSTWLFNKEIRKSYFVLFVVILYLVSGLLILYAVSPYGNVEQGLKSKLIALSVNRIINASILHCILGISILGWLLAKRWNWKHKI